MTDKETLRNLKIKWLETVDSHLAEGKKCKHTFEDLEREVLLK
jgi:hypothetical protein